ncbi:MAG: single-stranded-DNA-specific exonuclease RecJ [Oscillospiraceae bacterium]|nr:single-stranded-DNA-specific exonuclease RecJ [Oscillospiraceae bacterium]
MVLKRWQQKPLPELSFPAADPSANLLSLLLAQRGVNTPEEKTDFSGTHMLSDPFSLLDMDRAVRRVALAAEAGEKLLIFGDYDADGICATAILWHYLHNLGVQTAFYLPSRENEGYGLNEQVVRSAAKKGITLIITVDNGISCHSEVELAKSLGVDVVILDHHQPGEVLPDAAAVVDAHRTDQQDAESLRMLCGAGIALLFVAAMEGGDTETALEQYAHLAAIATIGDIMLLQKDNRLIVQRGLEILRYTDDGGLAILMDLAGIDRRLITAEQVAFSLVPRINATGRMGSATDALRLLLEEDREEAVRLAEAICRQNDDRRKTEAEITAEIEEMVARQPELLQGRIAFFAGENWHKGVIGITAARLMQKFGKPVFIASTEEGFATGSARSFGDFSVFESLSFSSDLLDKFGGHRSAGGFSCKSSDLLELKERLEFFAKEHFSLMPLPCQEIDLAMPEAALNLETVHLIETLEPFGNGNESPIFLLENMTVRRTFPVKEGKYVRFEATRGGRVYSFICFFMTAAAFPFASGDRVDLLFSASSNLYQGEERLSLRCVDIRPAGFPYFAYHLGLSIYEKFLRREPISSADAKKCLPVQEEMREIWKTLISLPEEQRTEEILFFKLFPLRIGYAKIRFAMGIMEELGLVSRSENGLHPTESVGKTDFRNTEIYERLARIADSED